MATRTGEASAFDFGPERAYNPSLLAEIVIWPLVNTCWNGDWRQESQDGDTLSYPKHGTYKGKLLDILLEADCDTYSQDDSPDGIRSATLYVEEITNGLSRKVQLEAARDLYLEGPGLEDDEEDELWEWPEGDEDEFTVKKGIVYSFDTDEDWYFELYRAVEGPEQRLSVPFTEAETEGIDASKLRSHDLEIIQSACFVLSAPRSIKKAIDEIRARPIIIN